MAKTRDKLIDRMDTRMFDLLLKGQEVYAVRVSDKQRFAPERKAIARQVLAIRAARHAITAKPPIATPRGAERLAKRG